MTLAKVCKAMDGGGLKKVIYLLKHVYPRRVKAVTSLLQFVEFNALLVSYLELGVVCSVNILKVLKTNMFLTRYFENI